MIFLSFFSAPYSSVRNRDSRSVPTKMEEKLQHLPCLDISTIRDV